MNHLPVEVCEQIFNHLSVNELKSVRATCRRWSQIVDGSPALLNRIDFVPPIRVMDRNCKPICAMRARNVTLKDTFVVAVDSWWESIGPDLTCLRLENCTISTGTLAEMLGRVPKLRFLSYEGDGEDSRVEAGVSLDQLEDLRVYSGKMGILDIFGGICPRLKRFEFGQQSEQKKLGEFLQKVKDTLECVRLISAANILDDLLQLKHLVSLEIQSDAFDNKTLTQIGASLPNLINLRVTIRNQGLPFTPTFLDSMRKLRSVSIYAEISLGCLSIAIDFSNLQERNLKRMYLRCLRPMNLTEYLLKSSQFSDLALYGCVFYQRSEMFGLFYSLKSLERLDLGRLKIKPERPIYVVSEYLSSLKFLKLNHYPGARETLVSILNHCENLEEIHLSNLGNILDEKILKDVCHKWKRLKKLTLASILLSESTVDYIKEKCPLLKTIDVSRCLKHP